MTRRNKSRRQRLNWRRIFLGIGLIGIVVAGGCLLRGSNGLSSFRLFGALPTDPKTPAAPVAALPIQEQSHDYCSEVVAVLEEGKQSITREELGEYLIARHGEKIEHLINRRVLEDACKAHGIEVTAHDVDQRLAEDLKDLNIDRSRFVKEFLQARHKTLFEWREDHLRPQLMMMKLYREQLKVTDEEVKNAYEARYAEKVDCRLIEWPKEKVAEAEAHYQELAANENAFAAAARKQPNDALATTGGKLRPFGPHTLEIEEIEKQALALLPGQVSPLIPVPKTGGVVLIKCDKRIPADTSIPLEKVKDELAKEVLERKAQRDFPKYFEELRKAAHAESEYNARDLPSETEPYGYSRTAPAGESKNRVVAWLYNKQTPLTRQDLGEYLIQRYGAETLELLVNKRIIESACKAKGIVISDTEVESEFLAECEKRIKIPNSAYAVAGVAFGLYANFELDSNRRDLFIKNYLFTNKTNVFEYKEDIIRPRMLMSRLWRDRVKCTDKDLAAAFEAHYGAKVKCRMIMWPKGEDKIVFQEYPRIRDSEVEFDKKARTQASPSLAQRGGLLEKLISRHTTGNEELEKNAFSLQPGEVSSVIEAPEGYVVVKCVEQIPANKEVSLDSCREELTKEVLEVKLQTEMLPFFQELQRLAHPRYILKNPNTGEDIADEVRRDLSRTSSASPGSETPPR